MKLLINKNTDIDIIIEINKRQEVKSPGNGINLARRYIVYDVGRDIIGLSEFTFNLNDERFHICLAYNERLSERQDEIGIIKIIPPPLVFDRLCLVV